MNERLVAACLKVARLTAELQQAQEELALARRGNGAGGGRIADVSERPSEELVTPPEGLTTRINDYRGVGTNG